jgi:hypothetical protein
MWEWRSRLVAKFHESLEAVMSQLGIQSQKYPNCESDNCYNLGRASEQTSNTLGENRYVVH